MQDYHSVLTLYLPFLLYTFLRLKINARNKENIRIWTTTERKNKNSDDVG